MDIIPMCGRFGCSNALNQRHRYRAVNFCSFECVEIERQKDGYYEGGQLSIYDPLTGCLNFRRP